MTKRVDLISSAPVNMQVAVYAPIDSTGEVEGFAKRLCGVFEESDRSWRFDLMNAPVVKVYFPSPEYEHTQAFLNAANI